MSKRILFLEVLPTLSGGQRALLDLVPGLGDYELHALLPAKGPYQEALERLGVSCHITPMPQFTLVHKSARDSLRMATSLPRLGLHTARLVRRLGIDLVYANNGRAFVWGTPGAILARRPILWHMHNVLEDNKSVRLIRVLGRAKAVRRIIAVSSNAAQPLRELGKTKVIPLGVDTNRFRPNSEARHEIRRSLGMSDEALCVGCIGDLLPLKRQDTIVQAAVELPHVTFLMVGEARDTAEGSHAFADRLQDEAGENVRFLGQRDDIPHILNALDLLIIASSTETGPRVLLEALASGVPVLSTRAGRASELVRIGETGAFFPVGKPQILVSQIRSVFARPESLAVMGQKARQVAVEELSMAVFHQRMHDELAHILAK